MSDFHARIQQSPVVAAVSDLSRLSAAVQSPCEIIFLLKGTILTVPEAVQAVHAAGKAVYIHLDLVEGFSRDWAALEYIRQVIRPDGIITTRVNLVKHAGEIGLGAIQRVFMLDSLSVETAVKSVSHTRPAAIELLPGIIPRIIRRVCTETRLPVIAGGLIESKEDIIAALQAGAVGISTSKEELWYM
ncbi:MAG: glycerol-3-phosphate responsive antiterminator [Firmicutes bacterium]|nr:glycerol-3-phosphate responsive antiterminator [Bacillota bacterium]HOB34601.1 glycerol-3-phosphate responsive antiterminator [Bacillota bacterium]HPZ90742.1 glycerol-3-phosphate responsive antiterminator [Bacillota bacterium]HQE02581.1 glycerol-3-phosphate responsive antiterminator [Bacillota bacterium]